MQKYLSLIKKSPLFTGTTDAALAAMLNCLAASIKAFAKNEYIFREGDTANFIRLVVSGRVQIVKDDFFGNRNIIAVIEPTQMFGEAFACSGTEKMPMSAIASLDSVILKLDCSRLITTCSNSCNFHQQAISRLLRIIASKNISLNQKIEIISQRTTREKILAYLFKESKVQQSSSIVINYNRQELADFLGVERSALSAVLSKLRRDGLIKYHKNKFELLTLDK